MRRGESGKRTSDLLMMQVWEGCQAAQGAMKKISSIPSQQFPPKRKKKRSAMNSFLFPEGLSVFSSGQCPYITDHICIFVWPSASLELHLQFNFISSGGFSDLNIYSSFLPGLTFLYLYILKYQFLTILY